ncbi:aldo/keto reductase [Acidobacteria bacterium AB60]|nr:aldo/keto reductase [Acidobacteria bacterium AB60]
MKRRAFLTSSAAVVAAGSLHLASGQAAGERADQLPGAQSASSAAGAAAAIPRVTHAGTRRGDMLYRPLGETGVEVSVIGLGGSHIGKPSLPEEEAIKLMHQAIDRGITFMDNSWDYNQGHSEERMGKALAQGGYRQKVFLMTKIDGRTKEEAEKQINQSLQRLQTDHLDLLQHHEIIRFDDPDRIFNEGGAMEAALEAKKAGKVRFIGYTGHKDPHIHLYMMEVADRRGFHFDTVQMPINVMDAHYRSFAQLVVPQAMKRRIAVLGMKCFGSGVILKSNAVPPLDCLHYSLNVPVAAQITGIDKQEVLDQALEAVKQFRPMEEAQVAAILTKSHEAALQGKYELFKTSTHFDSTIKHPEWLGGETPEVERLGES